MRESFKEDNFRLLRKAEDSTFGECSLPYAERENQEYRWSNLNRARLDGEEVRKAKNVMLTYFPNIAAKLKSCNIKDIPNTVAKQAIGHALCAQALLSGERDFCQEKYLDTLLALLLEHTPKVLEDRISIAYPDIELRLIQEAVKRGIVDRKEIPFVLVEPFDYGKMLFHLSRVGVL